MESEAVPMMACHANKVLAVKKGFGARLVKFASSLWTSKVAKAMASLKAIKSMGKLAACDAEDFKNDSTTAIDEVRAGKSNVRLEVNCAKDLKKINYLSQGDGEHYTEEAIEQRYALQHNDEVIQAAKKWWTFLPKTVQDKAISRATYCAAVVLIQVVLLPMYGIKADLDYDPSEDWEQDSKGKDIMNWPDFYDALFELADLWAESRDAKEYVLILDRILEEAEKEMKSGLWSRLMNKFGEPLPDEFERPTSVKSFTSKADSSTVDIPALVERLSSACPVKSSKSQASFSSEFGSPPTSPSKSSLQPIQPHNQDLDLEYRMHERNVSSPSLAYIYKVKEGGKVRTSSPLSCRPSSPSLQSPKQLESSNRQESPRCAHSNVSPKMWQTSHTIKAMEGPVVSYTSLISATAAHLIPHIDEARGVSCESGDQVAMASRGKSFSETFARKQVTEIKAPNQT